MTMPPPCADCSDGCREWQASILAKKLDRKISKNK